MKIMNLRYFRHFIFLFKKLYWDYKWKIAFLIFLSFVSGFLGALSIGILVPLFSFVLKDTSVASDIISRTIFRIFDYFSVKPGLGIMLAIISSLFVLKAGILWIFNYIKLRLGNRFINQNRQELYSDLLKTKWPYLIKQKIGYLDNILMSDLKKAMGLFKMAVAIISLLVNFFAYLLVALSLSLPITLATLVFGLIIFFFLKPIFGKERLLSKKDMGLVKSAAHFINESILGLKLIKAMGVESRVAAKGAALFKRSEELTIKKFLAKSPTDIIEPVSVIFIAGVFAVSYRFDPGLNIAAFLAIIYLVQRIFGFVRKIHLDFVSLSSDIPSAKKIVDFRDEIVHNMEVDSGRLDFLFNDKLEFRNVSFFYRPDKLILKDINLSIKKGSMVGIIGRTGEGKTTIADLLLRLLSPTEGGIFLDNRNIEEIKLSEWRSNVGYVSQDIFLQNDTIANNIKFFDEQITDEEMIEATKKANINDFIEGLPDKFNTIVGERGIFLSGGQRQRIALARAFARKPQILILDEATSSLDNQSEALIKEAIGKFKNKITVIIISHRLSFIMGTDQVFALDDGKVIESGAPEDLLKDENSYLYKSYNA